MNVFGNLSPAPFALSLSKGSPCPFTSPEEGQGFDRLSPNGNLPIWRFLTAEITS
jgi:hypothetical protein